MLVALLSGQRVDAFEAAKGHDYFCPNCRTSVILKKGRVVIHHFAHKPPTDCTWASGETREHLLAKIAIRDAFRNRGYQSDVEVEILSGSGDRRADVLIMNNRGVKVAVEIQHTPIPYDAMERRTKGYIAAKVPVMWIGILSKGMKDEADPIKGGREVERYVVRPWEKWAHAYCFKELWYIDPYESLVWKGQFSDYNICVESSSWYTSEGEEQYVEGYSRISKKWKTLTLSGPFSLADVQIGLKRRKPWVSKYFELPGGQFAHFRSPDAG